MNIDAIVPLLVQVPLVGVFIWFVLERDKRLDRMMERRHCGALPATARDDELREATGAHRFAGARKGHVGAAVHRDYS